MASVSRVGSLLVFRNSRCLVSKPMAARSSPGCRTVATLWVHSPSAVSVVPSSMFFNWILEVFPGVGSQLDQQAATLSRGESTLLAIARGLMCRPKVMLIDEPFGGLSSEAIEDLASTLRMIARKGTTVVFTEQHAGGAALATERTLVLQPGGRQSRAQVTVQIAQRFRSLGNKPAPLYRPHGRCCRLRHP